MSNLTAHRQARVKTTPLRGGLTKPYRLIEWSVNTGLGTNEINNATTQARELLDSAGCEDTEIIWGSQPVKAVEAIMQTAGQR